MRVKTKTLITLPNYVETLPWFTKVSSALGELLSLLDIELCGFTTPTDFRMQAFVKINMGQALSLAFGSSTFGTSLTAAIPNLNSSVTASLSFMASYSRPLIRATTLAFSGTEFCTDDYVSTSSAPQQILQVAGGWRFAAGNKGTFACSGEAIKFKKTSDKDLTVELKRDPDRDTVEFDLTITNPVHDLWMQSTASCAHYALFKGSL